MPEGLPDNPKTGPVQKPIDFTIPNGVKENFEDKSAQNRERKNKEIDEKLKDMIKIETNTDNLSELEIAKLMELQDREEYGQISLALFGARINQDGKMEKFDPDEKIKLAPGDQINVDFQGNEDAEWNWGAGDMLDASVRMIKITDTEGNERIGVRKTKPRVGYYDEGGIYIPVFSGYEISIPDESEVEVARKEHFPEYKEKGAFIEDPAELALLEDEEKEQKKYLLEDLQEKQKQMDMIRQELEKEGIKIDIIPDKRHEFALLASALAKKIEKQYGVPWQVCAAQACLETGFGKHAPGLNFFGIKGKGQILETKEEIDGQMVKIKDGFRAYKSILDSFNDYGSLLKRKYWNKECFSGEKVSIYAKGGAKESPTKFLEAIMKPPPPQYGTDSGYVEKAVNVAKKYGIVFDVD